MINFVLVILKIKISFKYYAYTQLSWYWTNYLIGIELIIILVSLVSSGAVLQTLKIYVTHRLWMETSARLFNCVYLTLLLVVLIIFSIVFSNVSGMAWIVVTALFSPATQNIYILSYHIQYKNKSPHLIFFRMLLLIFLRVFPGICTFIFVLGLWSGWFSSMWVVGYVWNNCT